MLYMGQLVKLKPWQSWDSLQNPCRQASDKASGKIRKGHQPTTALHSSQGRLHSTLTLIQVGYIHLLSFCSRWQDCYIILC